MAILEKMTRGRADGGGGRSAGDTIDYVDDLEKCAVVDKETGEITAELRTGINCNADSANREMEETRSEFGKNSGVQVHHFSLSFNPADELSPEEHHAHAVNFAERNFPDYEALVVTHTDTDHVHSHIVLNSVNMVTGNKYHRNAKDTHADNQKLNDYCKEFDLSFTEPNEAARKPERFSAPADKYKNAETRLFIQLETALNSSTNDNEFLQKLGELGIARSHYSDASARYTDSAGVKLTAKKIKKVYGEDYTKKGLQKFRLQEKLESQLEAASADGVPKERVEQLRIEADMVLIENKYPAIFEEEHTNEDMDEMEAWYEREYGNWKVEAFDDISDALAAMEWEPEPPLAVQEDYTRGGLEREFQRNKQEFEKPEQEGEQPTVQQPVPRVTDLAHERIETERRKRELEYKDRELASRAAEIKRGKRQAERGKQVDVSKPRKPEKPNTITDRLKEQYGDRVKKQASSRGQERDKGNIREQQAQKPSKNRSGHSR